MFCKSRVGGYVCFFISPGLVKEGKGRYMYHSLTIIPISWAERGK